MSRQETTKSDFDAIVVGARCAGSPTAMLLARKGYRVLLVDRATFPSDTISTQVIHPTGMSALHRWGLRDRLLATGCPPMHTYSLDFGPFEICGRPGTEESPLACAPRRTILDKLLVDAAVEAGAEVRESFFVEELLFEDGRVAGIRGRRDGGAPVTITARVVVGADGRHSRIAREVRALQYNARPPLQGGYYTYFSGLPVRGFEIFVRPGRAVAAIPTHDDLTLVVGGFPYDEFEANRHQYDGHWFSIFELVPEFQERLAEARQEDRLVGGAVPNYFRKPYGPGWALVGDAGYNKDPVTAQGISDAFRDAELCAGALDEVWRGLASFEAAMTGYQAVRDGAVLAMYEFTCRLATLEPPPPELQQVLRAVSRSQEWMDRFVKVIAGVTSPAEFFAPDNLELLVAGDSRQAVR